MLLKSQKQKEKKFTTFHESEHRYKHFYKEDRRERCVSWLRDNFKIEKELAEMFVRVWEHKHCGLEFFEKSVRPEDVVKWKIKNICKDL